MTFSRHITIRSIARFFQFDRLGTTYRTEILAGVTTFIRVTLGSLPHCGFLGVWCWNCRRRTQWFFLDYCERFAVSLRSIFAAVRCCARLCHGTRFDSGRLFDGQWQRVVHSLERPCRSDSGFSDDSDDGADLFDRRWHGDRVHHLPLAESFSRQGA